MVEKWFKKVKNNFLKNIFFIHAHAKAENKVWLASIPPYHTNQYIFQESIYDRFLNLLDVCKIFQFIFQWVSQKFT